MLTSLMVDAAELHVKCVDEVTPVVASAGAWSSAAAGIVKFTATVSVSDCTKFDVPPLASVALANSVVPPAAAINGKVASTVVVTLVFHSAACVVPNC